MLAESLTNTPQKTVLKGWGCGLYPVVSQSQDLCWESLGGGWAYGPTRFSICSSRGTQRRLQPPDLPPWSPLLPNPSRESLERNIRSWTHASMRSLWPCSDSSRTPSFSSQLQGKIGLPRANPRGSLKSPSFSRIQNQLEKNDVVPTSSQNEALACYSVPRVNRVAQKKRGVRSLSHPWVG